MDKSKVAVLRAGMNLDDGAWIEAEMSVDCRQHDLTPNATRRSGLILQRYVVGSQFGVGINEAMLGGQNPPLVAT
jgi:hypothetical protein